MPTAPEPANRSTKTAPCTSAPKILKSVSRRRSLDGRSAMPFSVCNLRLRYVPAITRMSLAHRCQPITPLPLRIEPAEQTAARRFGFRILHQREGFTSGKFEQFAIAQRIGYVQPHGTVLARTEKFAGTAQLQVHLRDG